MNEVATFFRDRERGEGEIYRLEIDAPRGSHRVSIYAQRPFDSGALRNQELSSEREVEAAFKDLRNGLATQGGGGLIVRSTDDGGSRTFMVSAVGAKSYRPPDRCMVLAPGRPPISFKVDAKEDEYPAGAHILVPVDEDAEQRLHDFVSHLDYLPPDLQSLVLHSIRRPSLDKRLNRVETELFRRTADEALAMSGARGFVAFRHRMRAVLSSTVARTAAVVLLVLLTAGNGFLLYRLDRRLDAVAAISATQGQTSTVTDTVQVNGTVANDSLRVEPFVDDAKTLFERLRQRRQSDQILGKVFTTHFASLADGELTPERVAEAVKEPADGEQGAGNRAVLWGLIKLQLLAFDPNPANSQFLESADAVTLTKTAYAAMKPKVEKDAAAQRFLSAVACRLRYTPALPFQGDCKSVSEADLEAGMQRLSDMVDKWK